MRKIIVAGGRKFQDYEFLERVMDVVVGEDTDIEIVSGTARGADSMGELYAQNKGFKLTRFPAKWKEFGRSAGPIRNEEMAEYADELAAFWDGKSTGTKHMVRYAGKLGLEVRLFFYDDNE